MTLLTLLGGYGSPSSVPDVAGLIHAEEIQLYHAQIEEIPYTEHGEQVVIYDSQLGEER